MTLTELDAIARQLDAMRDTERMPSEIQALLRAVGRHPIIEPWGELWVSDFPDAPPIPVQFNKMKNLNREYVTSVISILESVDLVEWEKHIRGRELLDESGNGSNGERVRGN